MESLIQQGKRFTKKPLHRLPAVSLVLSGPLCPAGIFPPRGESPLKGRHFFIQPPLKREVARSAGGISSGKSSPTMSRFTPSSHISKAANCKNRTKQKTGFSKRNPVFLLRQYCTKSVWRLCTPSACKFSIIFHKNAREYIKYSLRFLFHLTKNLTTHLSHNLCAVLPYLNMLRINPDKFQTTRFLPAACVRCRSGTAP